MYIYIYVMGCVACTQVHPSLHMYLFVEDDHQRAPPVLGTSL